MQLPGLVFAVPTRGTLEAAAVNSHIAAARRWGVTPLYCPGFPRDWNRNRIVQQFLDAPGTEWLLFVDDDTLLPEDAIGRLAPLAADGKTVIVGLAPMAVNGLLAMSVSDDIPTPDRPTAWANWHASASDVPYRVAATGLPVALLHRSALERVGSPWFVELYGDHLGNGRQTEDIHFCRRCREEGIEIWCQPSLRCGHLKQVNLCEWVPLAMCELPEVRRAESD